MNNKITDKEMEEALKNTLSYKLQELENAIEDLKKCVGEEIRKTKLYKFIKRVL